GAGEARARPRAPPPLRPGGGGECDCGHDRGDPVRVSRRARMPQRGLRLLGLLVPGGRAAVEMRDQLRLVLEQLAREQVTEQVVEAVRRTAGRARYDDMGPRQPLEREVGAVLP